MQVQAVQVFQFVKGLLFHNFSNYLVIHESDFSFIMRLFRQRRVGNNTQLEVWRAGGLEAGELESWRAGGVE